MNCQTFNNALAEIKQMIPIYQQAIQAYIVDPSNPQADLVYQYIMNAKETLISEYQKSTLEMLKKWYLDSKCVSHGVDRFLDSIEFEESGRVAVNSVLLGYEDVRYFPSIIRRFALNLTFQVNNVESADYLEEVDGAVNIKGIKSMKGLRRVGKWANFNEGVQDLSGLEEVGVSIDLKNTRVSSLPKLRKTKGFFVDHKGDQSSKSVAVPLLKTVDDNVLLEGLNEFKMPEMEAIGGILRIDGHYQKRFRDGFPKLQKVGTMGNGMIYVGSPEFADEIERLRKDGSLRSAGPVQVEKF